MQANLLNPRKKLLVMLCFLIAMMAAVEFVTRLLHNRRRLTVRVENSLQQAILIRPAAGTSALLFAGNSLVFDDLSKSDLQQAMGQGFTIYTAGVPGSTYEDWRYGMRALFARGSRPDALVFDISPSQFLRPPATTAPVVSQLWRDREVWRYQSEQHPGLTAASELFLERHSAFFALRETIRTYARKFIPGYVALSRRMNGVPASVPDAASSEAAFLGRISALQRECEPHTRLLLLISPTNQEVDERLEPSLKSAAAKLGIPVIEPVAEREWPLGRFQPDGYHLKAEAAAQFSKLVAADLQKELQAKSGANVEAKLGRRPWEPTGHLASQ